MPILSAHKSVCKCVTCIEIWNLHNFCRLSTESAKSFNLKNGGQNAPEINFCSATSKPVKTAPDLEIPTVAPAWAPRPRVAQGGEEDDEALTLLPLPMAPLLAVYSLSLHQALIPWKERGEKERDLLASTHIDKEKLQRDGGLKSSSSSSPMKVTST